MKSLRGTNRPDIASFKKLKRSSRKHQRFSNVQKLPRQLDTSQIGLIPTVAIPDILVEEQKCVKRSSETKAKSRLLGSEPDVEIENKDSA